MLYVESPEETAAALRYDNRALQERVKKLEAENSELHERIKKLKTQVFSILYPELYERARTHPILNKLL